MDKTKSEKSGLNPWVVFFITAPIPLLLFVLFLYKWHQQKTDFERIKSDFLERQNNTLAYEALGVANRVREILEAASVDVELLSLMPASTVTFKKFYESHQRRVTSYQEKTDSISVRKYPTYNEVSFVDLRGQERLRFSGTGNKAKRSLKTCTDAELCDGKLWKDLLRLPPGSLRFGQLMRWYSRRGELEDESGAALYVGYRSARGVSILGIDFRHILDVLYLPTFPYNKKKNLYQGYLDGNYIYFVDSDLSIIAHPKYWHITGIDRATGQRRPFVKDDSHLGQRPLNMSAYQGEKLRDYFNRLLNVSFAQKSVDIFKAPNLTDTIRVVSVAPIVFDKAQFKEAGVFGYVMTGCNAEFFKEPKERFLPYY